MDDAANSSISEPLDLVKLALGERVFIKLRGDRTVTGVLHAYDAHMNVVLSQVEESVHLVDVTEDGQALPPRVERRNLEMLFVRGDGVILISPAQQ
ncbi:U6 snRNA-associated Sm-like protein LSm3 [Kwoniella heveanensis CBS 569]|uniref:LSM complex subunit LSM3 n=1 Tax=Kwoniella heveanensis BCC8398 TaxID=1296120 RepID=A0A1B9GKY6_9TREE|nr:U6 snRNA-associated Sm-like protein LSm3 [Kwoniella heveanensis BCC8398]OCF38982.1 U6 snRNA-associated Sm-like protein LSm3 [Kwoniella heveanensis CBS 569]